MPGRQGATPGATVRGILVEVVLDARGHITGFGLSKVYVEGPLADKRIIDRGAVLDTGSEDGGMTVDLARLEAALVESPTLPPDQEEQDIPITVEPKEKE